MYTKSLLGAVLLLSLVGGYQGKIEFQNFNLFSDCSILNSFLRRFTRLAWSDIEKINAIWDEGWCELFLAGEYFFVNDIHSFYDISGMNNDNRPVIYIHFGKKLETELLKAFANPNTERLFQCASVRILRDAFRIASLSKEENEDVPKVDMIVDLEGSGLEETCCPACSKFPMGMTTKSLVSRLFFINAPPGFGELHPPNNYVLKKSTGGPTLHIVGDWFEWENILYRYFVRETSPEEADDEQSIDDDDDDN